MTAEGTSNQILNAGALGYRAPELAGMKKPRPSLKGDMYAFGVLLLELLTGQGAGDIISGQSGAVDLTDWVRLLVAEGRALDCFDPMLVGGGKGDEKLLGSMEETLELALKCISPQPSERPSIRSAYEELVGNSCV
jgi:serine/threonine protein kinase